MEGQMAVSKMDDASIFNYVVRRLQPEDAQFIPALTEQVNGPGYIHAELYHPNRLLTVNRTGEVVSAVAVHISDGIVGHLALERPDLGPVAEEGEAMVLPNHQHHHLLDRMKSFLYEEARKLRVAVVFGNAVTHHVFSQMAEERFKSTPSGFMLGASPAQAHRISSTHPQRVSLLTYYKYLDDPGDSTIHVPKRHQPILSKIYDLLRRAVRYGSADEPADAGSLSVSYDRVTQRGFIRVQQAGADSVTQIASARARLFDESGAEVVYVEWPLDKPGSSALWEEVERLGFFLSGVVPKPKGAPDWIRLQSVKAPLDLSQLQVYSPFARELLAYIDAERRRLRAG
jgi:hypothetical protein